MKVMVRKDLAEVQTDEARQTLLSVAQLYGERPDLFTLFGDFNNKSDVIFSVRNIHLMRNMDFFSFICMTSDTLTIFVFQNQATRLAAISDVLPSYEDYKKMLTKMGPCQA